jgi:hypothetical protein
MPQGCRAHREQSGVLSSRLTMPPTSGQPRAAPTTVVSHHMLVGEEQADPAVEPICPHCQEPVACRPGALRHRPTSYPWRRGSPSPSTRPGPGCLSRRPPALPPRPWLQGRGCGYLLTAVGSHVPPENERDRPLPRQLRGFLFAATAPPDLLNIGLWSESPQVGTSFSVG